MKPNRLLLIVFALTTAVAAQDHGRVFGPPLLSAKPQVSAAPPPPSASPDSQFEGEEPGAPSPQVAQPIQLAVPYDEPGTRGYPAPNPTEPWTKWLDANPASLLIQNELDDEYDRQ